MTIDSHQHFWQLARGDYHWLQGPGASAALDPLRRDFMPADLQPLLQAAGVTRSVLVQAADSTAETDFLLRVAAAHPTVGGVVGWLDMADPQAVHTLQAWAAQPAFKGVRPMLQDLPEVDWIERAPHPAVLQALLALGLRMDALVLPQHLGPLLRFVRAWPALPVVIDHAAKPPLAEGPRSAAYARWRQDMAALAALPQLRCKVSGLLTLLPAGLDEAATLAALRPLWDDLLALFGPARLMWGSDWPVLTLVAGYPDWHRISRQLAADLSPAEAARFWRGTAADFYALNGDLAP